MSIVTVAIPMHRVHSHAKAAFESICSQTYRDLEILILVNGSDERVESAAHQFAREDSRARVVLTGKQGLARALNVALREASGELMARMDDDDLCSPSRIEKQVEFLSLNTGVAMVGCAYDRIDGDGMVIESVRVPTEPKEIRWRLLLGNVFAHGSVVMRRTAVLKVGGYDESLSRAQDYDLWLRMSRSHELANLPDVLYQHRTRDKSLGAGDDTQQEIAAAVMLQSWNRLDRGCGDATLGVIRDVLAKQSSGHDPDLAMTALERELASDGPTAERLVAWLWAKRELGLGQQHASDVARRALLRERGTVLRELGVQSIWLWGAGAHTYWLLQNIDALGVEVSGIVDDRCACEYRFGRRIGSPDDLQAGDNVMLSSDWKEEELWRASEHARRRGVVVHRLYVECAVGSHAGAA